MQFEPIAPEIDPTFHHSGHKTTSRIDHILELEVQSDPAMLQSVAVLDRECENVSMHDPLLAVIRVKTDTTSSISKQTKHHIETKQKVNWAKVNIARYGSEVDINVGKVIDRDQEVQIDLLITNLNEALYESSLKCWKAQG